MNKHAAPTSATDKIPVTVAVPVKNEERALGACLERLGRFAEVVVVDSGSTDRTMAIAESFGATVVTFRWDGKFPKKRNWFLMNHSFATDWVLFLDADEIVDEAFCEAVKEAIEQDHNDGYWLNYTNYFLSQRLRHGVPQKKLALIRLGAGLYERIEEVEWSALDMEIHEHPIIEGPVGEIAEPIDHRDFGGVEKTIRRHIDYAKWEAKRVVALRKGDGLGISQMTPRQRVKYRNIERWWYPWAYFGYAYVIRLGFLDGRAGFYYAYYKAWYFTTIRLLLREHRHLSVEQP